MQCACMGVEFMTIVESFFKDGHGVLMRIIHLAWIFPNKNKIMSINIMLWYAFLTHD